MPKPSRLHVMMDAGSGTVVAAADIVTGALAIL
jgi:hypothetical protein